jgi:hypothetical protein
MSTINFKSIRATPKSQHDSFEALATLLFQRSFPVLAGSDFVSLRGEGGDGGVEAYFRDPAGAVHGVQAKYFFKLGASEFGQLKESLTTALRNYPELRSYVVYVPFDLTGRKAGGALGKSETERFDAWKQAQEALAVDGGKTLSIELVGATKAQGQLLALDPHGGMRRYWFDDATLTESTIRTCLEAAKAFAGPRYTETLDVETSAHEALDFFGGTGDVQAWVVTKVKTLSASFGSLARGLGEVTSVLTARDQTDAAAHVACIQKGLRGLMEGTAGKGVPGNMLAAVQALQPLMAAAEAQHYSEFCAKYGAEKDTPGFRQWHAEYMCAFPAGNLDRARDAQEALSGLAEALDSPAIQATRAQSLLLIGPAGVGKTHAIVSAAERRLARGAQSVVLFGDDFEGPSPWEVIRSKLGFAGSVSRHELFECLQAGSSAQGYPFVVFIDALNEGPLGAKWKDRLPEFLGQIKGYPGIKVCVSTRDTYKDVVVDSRFPGYAFTHPGFSGREFEALQHFAIAYGLNAEITPLFSEEAANPLFLHLACRTLQAKGATSLDLSLQSFLGLFEGYLELCNDRVRGRLGLATPGNLVRRAVLALASPGSASTGIAWTDACNAVEHVIQGEVRPAAFIEELRKEGLIIVTPSAPDDYVIRFGYQRYGDVLRAIRLLDSLKGSGSLDVKELSVQIPTCDAGLLEAFASVLPELEGIEITELGLPKRTSYPLFLQGLTWRAKESINHNAESVFRDALRTEAWVKVFETALKLSLVPDHVLNAGWLDWQLRAQPAANRDGFFWYALRTSYDDCGVVRSLVDAALLSDLSLWPAESRRLASVTLGWLCSSPDRRVRDQATKGLMRLIRTNIGLAKELAHQFDDCDDEYVLESVSGAIYCACLLETPGRREQFADALDALLASGYDRPNAVIRDNVRLLGAAIGPSHLSASTLSKLGAYPAPVLMPTTWPTETQAKDLLKHGPVVANMDFTPGPMQPDFWHYEVRHELERFDLKAAGIVEKDLGFWVMCEVMRLGFPGKNEVCLKYDGQIAHKYGQGRSRRGHAERLGKKYSWIAFHRLVGMLSDNLSPAKDWTGVVPSPGVLKYSLRPRKADITDVRDIERRPDYPGDLLPSPGYPFPSDGDNRQWLDREDLTSHSDCLIRRDKEGVEWVALSLSASADEKSLVDDDNIPYLRITLDYWTVLAPSSFDFKGNREALDQALESQAPSSYRAYFAEYPSEAAFTHCIEYREVCLSEGDLTSAHVSLLRGNEWGYDYSWKERAESLDVPTKALVENLHLQWDRHSGWVDQDERLAAFHVDGAKRSALFLRRDLLDKYLLQEGQVLYAHQFVYRGTIGGFGGSGSTPSVDINTLLVYRPGEGLEQLDQLKELFDPAKEDEV